MTASADPPATVDMAPEATSAALPKASNGTAATAASESIARAPPAPPKLQTNENGARQPTAQAPRDLDGDGDDGIDLVNPLDFQGTVSSNNSLPSDKTLDKIQNYMVLDRHGKSHSFKSLYSGRNSARRVLVIFVRHFFCGNCQEYLRTLAASITPDALLRLPISTFITVVGCGDPGLIDMYAEATGCQFPIYADPTRKLYAELGMIRTLALGAKPAYMKKSILSSSLSSIFQGLKQIRNGLATKAGDQRQIGGEFLFEPLSVLTPTDEVDRQLGKSKASMAARAHANSAATSMSTKSADSLPLPAPGAANAAANGSAAPESPDGANADDDSVPAVVEEKRVTWCHRMRSTRDHAEIPELMEILGLDGQGRPIKDKKRWSRAVEQRKGTGLSMAHAMSSMQAQAGGA